MSRKTRSSIFSFVLMTAFWTLFGNLAFALALMVALLVHEMGHYAIGKLFGVPTEPPQFMALGAYVQVDQSKFTSITQEVALYAAGPLAGSLFAALLWLFATPPYSPFVALSINIGVVLSLYNLMPIPPLDGGAIGIAIHRRFWMVGLVIAIAVVGLALMSGNILPAIFLFLMWSAGKYRLALYEQKATETPEYFALSVPMRAAIAALYFLTVGFLYYAMTTIAVLPPR